MPCDGKAKIQYRMANSKYHNDGSAEAREIDWGIIKTAKDCEITHWRYAEKNDPDGWIANENLAPPEWVNGDVMIDVKFRYGGEVVSNIRAGALNWYDCGSSTITHWRYHK